MHQSLFTRHVMLLLLFIAGGCCSRSTPVPVPQSVPLVPQHPIKECVPGVWNFGFVSHDVWRGATPTPDGFKTLAAMGVKTIIHVGSISQSKDVPPGVRYVAIPVSAWVSHRVDVYAVLRAIRDNPKPVFINCWTGADRSGMAVAGYRLSQGMSVEDAYKELCNFHVKLWFRGLMKKRLYQLKKEGLSSKWWIENAVPTPTTGKAPVGSSRPVEQLGAAPSGIMQNAT